MKKKFTMLLLSVSLLCCKKQSEVTDSSSDLKAEVYALLKDSMSVSDFNHLHWSAATVTSVQDDDVSLLRIPISLQPNCSEFVLILLRAERVVSNSRIIKLIMNSNGDKLSPGFNGKIEISTLRRTPLMKSRVINGYFENDVRVLSPAMNSREESLASPPNVINTFEPYKANTSVWMDWFSLTGTAQVRKAVSYINVTAEPNSGAGGGGLNYEEPLVIDFEPPAESLKPIEIEKFLKCFNDLPDAGAICSIEILADIPVDTNPNLLFDWTIGSPGHVFLQIKKTSGNKTVTQNIGFYPVTGWKTMITPAPVNGMFVDNGKHEFNAGCKQDISPDDFKKTLDHISYLARFIKYDIDEYNCTDFALSVYNIIRISDPLEIPKYDLPGAFTPFGSSTPQGLFNKLKSMKQSGTDASNINIPGVKGWVSESNGPCN